VALDDNTSWATIGVVKAGSGATVYVCQPSDTNPSCRGSGGGGGASQWARNATTGSIYPNTITDNVGIGTIVPGQALDVVGTVRAWGFSGFNPTATYWVDANRTDTYPAWATLGSINYPYKSLGALITGIGTPAGSIQVNMAPGTYIEGSPTFPNVALALNGNGAEIVTGSGAGNGTVTIQNYLQVDNITIVGTLSQTDASTAGSEIVTRTILVGGINVYGALVASDNSWLGTGASEGLITVEPGASLYLSSSQVGLPVSGYYSRILNKGTLIMDDDQVFANDNSNYALDSSTNPSQIDLNLVRIYNYGTSGGITMANNGASVNVNPNSIGHTYVFCHGSTNGIVGGTASALIDGYVLTYSFDTSPTPGYATGTNVSGRNFDTINVPEILGYTTLPLNISATGVGAAGNVGINTTGGNVGIGSQYPGQSLDVNGTARMTGFTLTSPNTIQGEVLMASGTVGIGTWSTISSGGGSSQWTGTNPGPIYYSSGNVGIGSANPGATLDVVGTISNDLLNFSESVSIGGQVVA